jgi:Tol biopolymer transport system component/DNA-binding winged helix-turn-helix (wHTH) protein
LQNGFRMGEFHHVEPSLNSVTGPAGTTRLEPKVMRVLVCLAAQAGQVVPKQRLMRTVWPDTFVGDDVLTRCISELRRVFGDDVKEPRFIQTIPKSGYRLIAPVFLDGAEHDVAAPGQAAHIATGGSGNDRLSAPLMEPASAGARDHARLRSWMRGVRAVGFTVVMLAALAAAWLFRASRTTPVPAMRVVALTAMSGSESRPVFSPDGRQIAFAWNGEGQDNVDIYVKLVGSSEVRRLSTDSGIDLAPSWSPDGRHIAYVRFEPPYRSHVRVMSSLGGSDRKVSDFPIWPPAVWSPDGRYVVAGRVGPPDAASPTNGIHLIPLQGGEPRAITRPKTPGTDRSPAFSPDGHRLAYASCGDLHSDCHVQVVDLDSTFGEVGSPRQLTGPLRMLRGSIAWSRDGTFLIFNAEEDQLNYLWRVGVHGDRPPERIEVAGANALFPSITHAGNRLAFTRVVHDLDVYRFEPGRPAQPVARSSVFDGSPQFSPDGRRIAFCSLRSGEAMEVWVANADGSAAEQLTHGAGPFQGDPSWSPDGRRIAFTSQGADGSPHIWTVDVDGGTPRQITSDPGDQMGPTWSRDGEWIYFSWTQGNERDMWRTRVRTGSKERVTHGGALVGRESADGTMLLYIPKAGSVDLLHSRLLAQPLAGGAPRPIIACIAGTAFSVSQGGIYYVPCSGSLKPDPDPPVRVLDPATGNDREIGRLEKFQYESLPSGFAVSPDGRTILYGRLIRDEADLMMIESFR